MAYDLGDAVNMKHAMRLASYMKHSPILQIGAESPIILRDGESTTVPVYYWGDGVLSAASDDPLLTVTVSGRNLIISKAAGANPEATITVSVAETTDYNADSAYIKVAKGHRYGFRIDENNSDPYTRVAYMYDAVGQTPAHMDFTNGIFDYGSWGNKWFVTENKPLMLRSDGTVDYYLDPYDYDLKADGTASDVSNTAYDGNAMAQFPLCWLKMWEDGTYKYCVVSDVQWDSDYKAYAHTRADGSIADYFYWSMFGGSGSSSKIRSLSGQTLINNMKSNNMRNGVMANGAGWDFFPWSQYQLIKILLILMGKSTNIGTVFGVGNANGETASSALLQTGTSKDKGQFFGFNTNNKQVKLFHMEHLYGEQWNPSIGIFLVNGKIYVKMTPENGGYSLTSANGYTNTGITLSGTGWGYVNKVRCSELGMIPTEKNGSASTDYCTYLGVTASQTSILAFGGSNGNNNGGFGESLRTTAETTSNFTVGCGLSCEMPAPTV